METTAQIQLQHERVDDLPLLIGFLLKMGLPQLLDRFLGSHHLHEGLSNGNLAVVWIAFLLSKGNHCKVSVQDWANTHHETLQTLLDQPVRRHIEFSDDRLGIVLRRFSEAPWEEFESELWQATCQVYEIPADVVRLDATSSYGYHVTTSDGLMQYGHSKDHRPDLPQFKLMAAVAQPTSQVIACDIVPGNCADDPLYLPLIRRIRKQLGRKGLLYIGDCKMAALEIRADLADKGDYYLMPLPRTGENPQQIDDWIEQGVTGRQQLQFLWRDEEETGEEEEDVAGGQGEIGRRLLARGYETERTQEALIAGRTVTWTERVQVIQSLSFQERQSRSLESRLRSATAALLALTPPVGRGRTQIRSEELLQTRITEILQEHDVAGQLVVSFTRQEEVRTQHEGPGRPAVGAVGQQVVIVRYQITVVERNEVAIAAAKERLGWRVQVTNMPSIRADWMTCVLLYNQGWSVERYFHMAKDLPLGIQPLFVHREDQITGLIRLLTIALRVLTLIEIVVRSKLETANETIVGLYEGQPIRQTARPTATRMLKAITRLEISWMRIEIGGQVMWHMGTLPPLVCRILGLLDLPERLYTRLPQDEAVRMERSREGEAIRSG
jgi:transposase